MATVYVFRIKKDNIVSLPPFVVTTSPDTYKHSYDEVDVFEGIPDYIGREINGIEGEREWVGERLSAIMERHRDGQHGISRVMTALGE